MNDLKYAFRQLLKNPGITAVAVITLALCLGANLTTFAVMDSVPLRPWPFPDADRLVTMFNTCPKAGVARDGATLPNYYELRDNVAAVTLPLACWLPARRATKVDLIEALRSE